MARRRLVLPAAASIALLAIAAAGYFYWQHELRNRLPDGIARTNGRIEAEQVEIATKIAGRVTEVLVNEGDMVKAGDVIARMDAVQIEAQLRGAEAQARQAAHVKAQAEAVVTQRTSERDLAKQEFERGKTLHATGNMPTEALDKRRSNFETAEAVNKAAAAALEQASAAVDAAQANVAQMKSLLADTVLTAPRDGRIQYRLANPGEVLPAGGRVATLLDLTDVYMTVFLPARRRPARFRRRGAPRARPGAAICHPGDGHLRRGRGPVHAERGRDPGRAREADVPRQGQDRAGAP